MYQVQFEAVSNRADWIETVELINDDSGEVIFDLSGVTAVVEVRSQNPCCCCLRGTTEDGRITMNEYGIIQWHFSRSEMATLAAATYEIGFTIEKDGITEQEIIGTLPVLDGVVRR